VSLNQHISSEWQQVIDYYNNLTSQETRDQFLAGLSGEQKTFLLSQTQSSATTSIVSYTKPKKPSFKERIINWKNLFSFKKNKQRYGNNEKFSMALLLTGSTVFGLLSFIITGLLFNYSNTIFFIRQIPVFGSVLGVESTDSRESYYDSFDTWLQRNDYSFEALEDEDRDGILNIDEFILGLDPQTSDENSNDVVDGQDFLTGTNPNTGGLFDGTDPIVYERFQAIDSKEIVHNRLVSYSWESRSEFLVSKDLVKDELTSSYEILDVQGNTTEVYEIDTTKPLILTIEKIGLFNQRIQLQNENSSIYELLDQNEVHHLFASPLPGEKGDSTLTLPNLSTEPTTLRSAASKLNLLSPNNQIRITATTTDNQIITMTYDIVKNNVYNTDGINYSSQLSESQIILSSSWPEDTYEKRVFVVGKLTSMSLESNDSIGLQ
jgi:hypothetical protein